MYILSQLRKPFFKKFTRLLLFCGLYFSFLHCKPSLVAANSGTPLFRKDSSANSVCHRKELQFLVGANVVDLDDSEDEDPKNDGLRGFGSQKSKAVLEHLKTLGVNSIVLPVDVYAEKKGQDIKFMDSPLTTQKGLLRLQKMIQQAKEKQLQVTVVPHLQLSDHSWRGDFLPRSVPLFLTQYYDAIAPILALAEQECVENFSFAVEFKAMATQLKNKVAFETLIQKLRKNFNGKLSYSANWDEADYVHFWPSLDVIGINAFAPLAESIEDSDLKIQQRVQDVLKKIKALSMQEKRPVVWWEVGFKATKNTMIRPWEWPKENKNAAAVDEKSQYRAFDLLFNGVQAASLNANGKAAFSLNGLHLWMIPSDLNDKKHPWRFENATGFSILGKLAETRFRSFARENVH